MNGLLEQLLAALAANTAALNANTAALNANTAAMGQPGNTAQTGPGMALSTAGALASQPPASPPPAGVTAEQITALIQPHIGNEAIKTALGETMRGMGINSLPETQPHQYGPLYSAFQAVLARFTGAGQGGGTPPSII